MRRIQETLIRKDAEKKERDEEERKRKANQMSEFEVNITYAKQLKNILDSYMATNVKKLKMSIETIQIFSAIKIGTIPNHKKQIPEVLELVDSYIKEQEKLHND